MKHLLKLADLSREEILSVLNLADQLKYERKHGVFKEYLKGKKLGMIFQKSSTRTRVSFYLDAIMIRTFAQQEVEDLAKYGSIPVINGLTDYCHPCQVLADLMTIRERKGAFKGLKMCFVGDGNNMANSLMVGAVRTGMSFSIACPEGYEPDKDLMAWAKENGSFTLTRSAEEAAADADVVYTDVWASMGQEDEKAKREKAFAGYQVNAAVMASARPDAMVLHCLPAHRGEEITAEVFEAHADEIFEEAENRLHAQKAVLCKVMK